MNAFKKYVRSKGIKLDMDYECMPYGDIDCVVVDAEKATVSEYHYCYGWLHLEFGRDGEIID